MAIAPMKRVTILGHESVVESVVDALQAEGVLEVSVAEAEAAGVTAFPLDADRVDAAEDKLARARFVESFLSRFHTSDQPFSMFVSEKVHLDADEYWDLASDDAHAAFESLEAQAQSLADEEARLGREEVRLAALLEALEPWRELDLPIGSWEGTPHVALFAGTVPASQSDTIRQRLRELSELVSVHEVQGVATRQAWVVLADRRVESPVRELLFASDFTEVEFPDLFDLPATEIDRAREGLAEARERHQQVIQESKRLAAVSWSFAHAFEQRALSELDALNAREGFLATERAFLISGWSKAGQIGKVEAALAPYDSELDVTFSDPASGDEPPVALDNPRWLKPFEVLVDLYGRPAYSESDPTVAMAPFFFLFFGMCLGDFAYGALLVIGSQLIKRRLDVAPGVKKFMDLLTFGGIASMIWGIVTRSFFAMREEWLPSFLRYEPLLDPGTELIALLVLTVVLGVIHVGFGVFLGMRSNLRKGRVLDAVTDQGSTLVFIATLVIIALSIAGVLPSTWWGPALVFGIVQLVILQGGFIESLLGRNPRWQVVLTPFKGLLGLYGMVGYASDFLSYTRLAALGLASMYVGDAMNRLTELSWGIPVVGVILAIAIFAVGHALNVIINILGAFVHPTRLQFVEFFGKFYTAGGRMFKPLAVRDKQLVLSPAIGAGSEKER